ncbi:hypothetical protein ACFXG4_30255 [Nocardia sp. NPDC059246]|uniref:hypothetical protein n=1 Tax=unclassified Nocardia TaxID=2637762 RepID=UPI0036B31AF6
MPIAFGAAGQVLSDRSDEIISRVDLFNCGGGVVVAVTLGLVAKGPTLGLAFSIPAIVLDATVPLVQQLGSIRSVSVGAEHLAVSPQ